MKPTWLIEAEKYVWLAEVPWPKSNPTIQTLWSKLKGGLWFWNTYHEDDSQLPWCGMFAATCLQNSGLPYPEKFASAKSYETYGISLPSPAVGSIVTFTRDGGGHVAFVVGQDASGNLICLGGNQGDKVCLATFARSRATSFRWPKGVNLPPTDMLPIMDKVEMSKREA